MSDDNIVNFGDGTWYKAEDLARKLDVSVRTVYNRLQRGEIQKTETQDGVRYRVPPDEGQNSAAMNEMKGSEAPERLQSGGDFGSSAIFGELLQLIQSLQEELQDAQFSRGRLSAVEERVDELKAENQALKGARARLHVAEGRRELAEERLHQKNRELERAQDEVKRLRRQLEQAERSAGSTWSIFS